MKRLRMGIARFSALGSFTAVTVVLGFNCGQFDTTSAPSIAAPTKTEEAASAPPVALMTSEQMLKAMISATGTEGLGELTDTVDANINDTYNLRTGSLPSLNSLNQVTGPTLISVTNLASSVCAKAVERDAAIGESDRDERLFFREFDFSKGLAGQTSDSVTMSFERLARNAWRRDVSRDESEAMLTFAQEFSTGLAANVSSQPAQSRLLAISVCTAVLSSIDSLTY